MKRYSVREVRQALIGKGNLRTLISDRIEDLDPYKLDTAEIFKNIFNEEAIKGWLQVQQLFIDVPKISILENTWAVIAHSPELIAFLMRGVEIEKDKLIVARARKLFKITELDINENTFDAWLINGDFNNLPNLLNFLGFSKTVRVRWSLAKKLREKENRYSELLKISASVAELPTYEASNLLKEAIKNLQQPAKNISRNDATCFTQAEMDVFSFNLELIPLIYKETKKTTIETINHILLLQNMYRKNVSLLTNVLNKLARRDWEAAGETAETIKIDITAKLAVKNLIPSANTIVELTSDTSTCNWTSMSNKGYDILEELFPKGSLLLHWTFNSNKIIEKLVDNSLIENILTQADISQLDKSWTDKEKIYLINSLKFTIINPFSPIWKSQSLKTLLHSAILKNDTEAEKFLSEHLTNISGPQEVLESIISINNTKTSKLLRSYANKRLSTNFLRIEDVHASNWNELIARVVGTKEWLIAKENSLIENANIDQILHALQLSSHNRLLDDFKRITIEILQTCEEISEVQAKKLISCLKIDSSLIEYFGPNLNKNIISKITELSEADSAIEVIQKLYKVVKEEHKFSLWQMQTNHVLQAEHLIEISLEGIQRGYRSNWNNRWKHVSGSVEAKARALAISTCTDPIRLKKIRVDFNEETLSKALLWASEQLSNKHIFKKVYLELTSLLGIRHANTLQWLLIQRNLKAPSGCKLDHLYKKHEIPKKSGKIRVISVPDSGLKRIQKSININILQPLGAHKSAFGFVKDRSIVGNARVHVGKQVVVNADVQNCFPSVRWPLIYAALKRDLSGKVSKTTISVLIDICTAEGVLPIGAPTSPALLNRVLFKTDEILTNQAKIKMCDYSRYADDLTFSGDDQAVGLLKTARKILQQIGLEIEDTKTNIFRRGRRQMCTGLVVNDKVNVPRRIRKRIRASVHAYELGKDLSWDGQTVGVSSLRGRLEFLKMVNPLNSEKLQHRFTSASDQKKKVESKQNNKKKLTSKKEL